MSSICCGFDTAGGGSGKISKNKIKFVFRYKPRLESKKVFYVKKVGLKKVTSFLALL